MSRYVIRWIGMAAAIAVVFVLSGCADDVRTTKTITTHEEEPVEMVSPGTDVVE